MDSFHLVFIDTLVWNGSPYSLSLPLYRLESYTVTGKEKGMEYMYQGYYSQGMIIPEPKKETFLEENQLVYIFPIKKRRSKAMLSSAVKTGKNHAAGILSRYANPSLIKSEREVFENALVERHLEK